MPSLPPWLAEFARTLLSAVSKSGRGTATRAGKRTGTRTTSPRTRRSAPKSPPSSQRSPSQPVQRQPVQRPPADEPISPGQYGPEATVEVDPHRIGAVRMTYRPNVDGDPDPGEIVWTWVPFEENDGRGKDRPVLVVAAEQGGALLAVQLTSKEHNGDRDFISIGAGSWDGEHRPSWVNIDRVVRVFPSGMRREAAALDRAGYAKVESALKQRYGWH